MSHFFDQAVFTLDSGSNVSKVVLFVDRKLVFFSDKLCFWLEKHSVLERNCFSFDSIPKVVLFVGRTFAFCSMTIIILY